MSLHKIWVKMNLGKIWALVASICGVCQHLKLKNMPYVRCWFLWGFVSDPARGAHKRLKPDVLPRGASDVQGNISACCEHLQWNAKFLKRFYFIIEGMKISIEICRKTTKCGLIDRAENFGTPRLRKIHLCKTYDMQNSGRSKNLKKCLGRSLHKGSTGAGPHWRRENRCPAGV